MQTKQDYAYGVLRERITSGSLLPGQRIVVNRLAQEIGTSAIPVREALLRLEAEGLVTITPHVGAVVTHITGQMIDMTLETLAVMEGYATRLAAARSQAFIGELKLHNEAMRQAVPREDWETFSRENRELHFAVYGQIANTVLTKTIRDLWGQLDSYLSASAFNLMPDRAEGSVKEHAQIIALLEATEPDLDAVEALARQHKLNTARRLQPARGRESRAVRVSEGASLGG